MNLRRRRFPLLLLPLLAALACSAATEPMGSVTARATVTGILVRNGTPQPIFYLATEQGTLAVLDFIQCTDATRCPTIAPGETKELPWNQVIGYAPNLNTYVLIWWQAPTANGHAQNGQVVVHR